MPKMTPFQYGNFYDVPRCISLHFMGRRFLLQCAFDDDLDEYLSDYSIYIVPEATDESRPICHPDFLSNTPMACIGHIPIHQIQFDPTKRAELDASILDSFLYEGVRSRPSSLLPRP
jgi:hypothetical protein